jgi:hypothetical protein
VPATLEVREQELRDRLSALDLMAASYREVSDNG